MATGEAGAKSTSISVGSHDTALCIIPPRHQWPPLDRLRSRYDKAYEKWPPHVNLIYPFARVETLPRACEVIELALGEWGANGCEESFRLRLDSAGVFEHRNDNTIFLCDGDDSHNRQLRDLRRRILEVLGHQEGNYRMHLTLGQSEDVHDSWHKFLLQKANLLPPVEWEIGELCVLIRERTPAGGYEMKKWASIPLSGGNFSRVQLPLSFYDTSKADVASDVDVEEPRSEKVQTRPCFHFSTTEDSWVPSDTSAYTPGDIPETLVVSSYNVLAEFHYPPSQDRYPLLVRNILSDRATSDVLVLQEVTDDFLSYLLDEDNIRETFPFASHGPPDQEDIEPLPSHNNIVVLSSFAFDWESVPSKREHKISMVVKFKDLGIWDDADFTPLVLAAVHLTCGLKDGSVMAKKSEIGGLLRYLATTYPEHPTILAGDFNISTSSFTLEAALEKKAISIQTASYLAGFEKAFLDAGFVDSWTVSHLEAGNASDDETENVFEGEQGATFDPTVNTLAESIVGSGFNMRPQRYDRILVRGEGLLKVSRFNKFGFITEETGSTTKSQSTHFASDHWGIRCILKIGNQTSQQLSNDIASQVVPVHLEAATGALADVRSLKESLQHLGCLPEVEEVRMRESALELLGKVILENSSANDVSSRYNAPFIITPVGSYGLGVWTSSSDIDCLCIGPVSANTFFALASHRLRKAADKGIKLLRRVKAHSGTMLELEVLGVKMDLQYCGATRVAEQWPDVMKLPSSDPIWTLPSQTLGKLKAIRDLDYVRRSIPDLVKFRIAHRFIKTWASSRGIYSSKWGYLGGFPITILLIRVCKFLARDAPSHSVADILTTFFSHYAVFDWHHKMAFDPFFHRQRLQYTRTPREPLAILGFHTPMLTTTKAASLPSVRTIAEELQRANRLLSQDGMTWSKFLAGTASVEPGMRLTTGATDFLKSYKSYVQITVQYWGVSLNKGSSFVGWLESRCVMVLVDINRRLPNIHARIWPARFVDESTSTETGDYQGSYLIGLDKLDDSMTKDDLKIAVGTLQTILGRFEEQIRGDEKYFDAKSSWMSASIVKQAELGDLTLDDRDWGEYNPGDDDSEEEEEEDEEQDGPMEESGSGREGSSTKKTKKGKKQQNQARVVPKPAGARKLRTAADVLNRLRWDSSLDSGDFIVGYEDRFIGAQEKALDTWKSEQTDEEFIPQHRILYFKRKSDGIIVWERKTRKDDIFGSGI